MSSILLSPIKINTLLLKNRVVLPPITMNFAENGACTDRDTAYHLDRVRGGCGLNMLDGALVETTGYAFRLALDQDAFVPPLAKLTGAVHREGGHIGIQLLHHGRCAPSGLNISRQRLVSIVPGLTCDDTSLVMRPDDIREVQSRYIEAGLRAKAAGFDLVELSAGHGYLLAQFMSPLTNKRTDAYGGTLQNRMRFPVELLRALRKALGKDFPLSVRLSVEEMVPGGLTTADTAQIAGILAENGADMISLSASIRETYQFMAPPACVPAGWLAEKAGLIKKALHDRIPVMVSGRITSAALGEKILDEGFADLIGMGRAQLADPYLVRKYAEGREDETIPCLGCNAGCGNNLDHHLAVTCAVNPRVGYESLYSIVPTRTQAPLRILVVGGGPAGMQFATTAAQRGHHVTLLEKEAEMGSRLNLVAKPPFKETYLALKQRMAGRCAAVGVNILLETAATAAFVMARKPDVVVLATGSTPLIPGFCRNATAVTAEEVLRGAAVGKRALILGGGAVGAETAEYLAEKGHQVAVLEMRDTLAADTEWRTRLFLKERLLGLGVQLLLGTKILDVRGTVVTAEDPQQNRIVLDRFDTLILAIGYRSHDPLGESLKTAAAKVITIGDCCRAGLVLAAVHQAYRAALAV